MRLLKDLTFEGYTLLKQSGMLWEFHPEATGNYYKDYLDVQDKKEENKAS